MKDIDLPVDAISSIPEAKPKKVKKAPKAKTPIYFNPKPHRFVDGVLALDIATVTGWCTKTASGIWDFTPKKNESKGMRLVRFKAKVEELCALEKITLIAFEQIAIYGKYPNTVGIEMVGVLKLFCEEKGINFTSYMPTQIKAFATGRGGASKDEMLSTARAYRSTVTDDNEADAYFLYQLAIDDLNL